MTSQQRMLLGAMMARILPGGDGPGAADANALACVDWMLSYRHRQDYVRSLVFGLDVVDSIAVAMWSKSFIECEASEQDAVLLRVQETPHPSVQRFFVVLVRVTLTGFLCAPIHGGNRNGVGWKHIGFDPHPFTLRAPRRTSLRGEI